jgi:small subunit ribosomal protein S10e
VRNIHVLDALRSLKSRGYVREVFNWCVQGAHCVPAAEPLAPPPPPPPAPPPSLSRRNWFYMFLTDEGVTYLRQFLFLDENVVPATLKKPAAPAGGAPREGERFGGGRGAGGPGGRFGDRPAGPAGYRREGGFGRGGGAPVPA